MEKRGGVRIKPQSLKFGVMRNNQQCTLEEECTLMKEKNPESGSQMKKD